ncbi:SGNH/GDSL hydrolase family protein [Planctomycetota bacterium]
MKVQKRYVFAVVTAILVIGIFTMFSVRIKTKTDTNKAALPSIDDVPMEYWVKLAEKKIFFGHQSVGYNIIEGVRDIINERDYIKLNIVETNDPPEFDRPIFAHGRVGRNTYPGSKIDAFENIMDAGVGNEVDIAFLKFCYIDIMRGSDPQDVFNTYQNTIEELKARYPETKFLHVTVPVCSTPKGTKKKLKESVKLLIGKQGVLDFNMKRQHYNTLLNDTYSKTDPVFDLALVESINPGGFRCYANKGAEKVFLMAEQYTTDGGHLNEKGRKKVAEQLLINLAELASQQ